MIVGFSYGSNNYALNFIVLYNTILAMTFTAIWIEGKKDLKYFSKRLTGTSYLQTNSILFLSIKSLYNGDLIKIDVAENKDTYGTKCSKTKNLLFAKKIILF